MEEQFMLVAPDPSRQEPLAPERTQLILKLAQVVSWEDLVLIVQLVLSCQELNAMAWDLLIPKAAQHVEMVVLITSVLLDTR